MTRKILVITSWAYNDALVQTYTLPYLRQILDKLGEKDELYLVTLEKNKVEVETGDNRLKSIQFNYHSFGFKGILMWMRLIFSLKILVHRKKINYVHVWGTSPGMVAYLITLFTRKKLIIDSYEPHAESMLENGTWKKSSLAYRVLSFFEKRLSKKADVLIATTEGMVTYSVKKYGLSEKKFFVKPACVNLQLFNEDKLKNEKLLKELNLTDKIVCVYAGKFGGIYLDKEIFQFIRIAIDFWGDSFRFLLLTGHSVEEIDSYLKLENIDRNYIIQRFVKHAEVPNYLGLGDFALTPVKPVFTKRFCTPIKDGEYWALGLPVVIPANISDDSEIIKENKIGYVLDNLEVEDYQKAVFEIDGMLKKKSRKEWYQVIRPIAEKYRNFNISQSIYSKIYK